MTIIACTTCRGSKLAVCFECHGTGKFVHQLTKLEMPCSDCGGDDKTACGACLGLGEDQIQYYDEDGQLRD